MKFAHFSDIHLGFQKNEVLQKIEQQVFEKALDECILRKVDFILIPGDLFHVNIPEMRVQKFAFSKFKDVFDAKIPVYVVYGSHDFSPVANSVIDLLEKIGYIIKVVRPTSLENDTIHLDFLVDQKTGAKIAGFSGLKVGKDREYYEKLDRSNLESEPGFKIFLFHGGISEMKTENGPEDDYMPMSLLPQNFDYYAGGHLHKFAHQNYPGFSNVVYPGTLFAGYHNDLEENAKGQQRGFVLVDFDKKINKVEFVPVENAKYELILINSENRVPESVNKELQEKAQNANVQDKIVILKIEGELVSGKTADVDTAKIGKILSEKGALVVNVSKNKLTSREYTITQAKGANKEEVETNVFSENIGQVRSSIKHLLRDEGVKISKRLLHELSQPKLENEKSADYISRIKQNGFGILGIKDDS